MNKNCLRIFSFSVLRQLTLVAATFVIAFGLIVPAMAGTVIANFNDVLPAVDLTPFSELNGITNSGGIGFIGDYTETNYISILRTVDLTSSLVNYVAGQSGTSLCVSNTGGSAYADLRGESRSTVPLSGTVWFSFLAKINRYGEMAVGFNGAGNKFGSVAGGVKICLNSQATSLLGAMGIAGTGARLQDVVNGVNGAVTAPHLIATNKVTMLILGRIRMKADGTNDIVDVWYNPDVPSAANLPSPTVSYTNIMFGSAITNLNFTFSRNPGNLLYWCVLDNIKLSDETNGFDVVYLNAPLPGYVSVSATSANSLKGVNPGVFTVTRYGGGGDSDLTIYYDLSGTAVNGVNYTTLPGQVTIPAGQSSAAITVDPIVDMMADGTQTVTLTLRDDSAYKISAPSSGTLYINDELVGITATATNAQEAATTGGFTVTRAGNLNIPTTVYYTVSGTASNGVRYVYLPGQATIPAGQSSAVISVDPIDDQIAEGTQTVVLTLTNDALYVLDTNITDTVWISDDVSTPSQAWVMATDGYAYERLTNCTGTFTIYRNDTSADATVNISLGGSGVLGEDYLPSATNAINFLAGESSNTVTITPIDNSKLDGTRTVNLMILPGDGYGLYANTNGTVSILDDDLPSEQVLFRDNFETTDSATNYMVLAGSINGGTNYSSQFAFDYSTIGLSPAPNGPTNTTLGLMLTANKNTPAGVAVVNLIPTNVVASGNFALRFELFLQWNLSAFTAEYALAGINQSGAFTNWISHSSPTFKAGDGEFVTINGESYTTEGGVATLWAPTNALGAVEIVDGSSLPGAPWRMPLAQILDNPPYGSPADTNGGGAFGCDVVSTTKQWVDCELSQLGNMVTFKANGATILTYTNTSGFTNGYVMIGYEDPFNSQSSADYFAVLDNVRVVKLTITPVVITGISSVGGVVILNFSADTTDVPANFKLQSAASVNGPYMDENAAIVTGSGGVFQATISMDGARRFYRIRKF